MDHLLRSATLAAWRCSRGQVQFGWCSSEEQRPRVTAEAEQTAPPLVDDGRYAAACAPRSLPDGNTPKKGSIAACTREPVEVEGGEAGSLWLAGRCYPR